MRPKMFKKGDTVTFSDKCPKKFRKVFEKGPKKIAAVEVGPKPYVVGGLAKGVEFRAGDLKLA